MILEGIVTTMNSDGAVNIAPMGPIVDGDPFKPMTTFELRPFKTSQTYANLKQINQGVLHVTDDVLLLAQAVLGKCDAQLVDSKTNTVPRLLDCCRFWEFQIDHFDETADRTRLTACVQHSETVRDFFGFNRGKHAVVEAAILASRVKILTCDFLNAEVQRLAILVQKTGGDREFKAFDMLADFISLHCGQADANAEVIR